MAPPVVCRELPDVKVLQRLIAGDLAGARDAAGVELPEEFLAETWLWTLRLGQLIGEPDCAPWLARGAGLWAVAGAGGRRRRRRGGGDGRRSCRVSRPARPAGHGRGRLSDHS